MKKAHVHILRGLLREAKKLDKLSSAKFFLWRKITVTGMQPDDIASNFFKKLFQDGDVYLPLNRKPSEILMGEFRKCQGSGGLDLLRFLSNQRISIENILSSIPVEQDPLFAALDKLVGAPPSLIFNRPDPKDQKIYPPGRLLISSPSPSVFLHPMMFHCLMLTTSGTHSIVLNKPLPVKQPTGAPPSDLNPLPTLGSIMPDFPKAIQETLAPLRTCPIMSGGPANPTMHVGGLGVQIMSNSNLLSGEYFVLHDHAELNGCVPVDEDGKVFFSEGLSGMAQATKSKQVRIKDTDFENMTSYGWPSASLPPHASTKIESEKREKNENEVWIYKGCGPAIAPVHLRNRFICAEGNVGRVVRWVWDVLRMAGRLTNDQIQFTTQEDSESKDVNWKRVDGIKKWDSVSEYIWLRVTENVVLGTGWTDKEKEIWSLEMNTLLKLLENDQKGSLKKYLAEREVEIEYNVDKNLIRQVLQ
eukprot:GDKJ01015712.1.p1 GENE.GDKJ01015712.1~~GDKJ01015712.1.p1  ORF type:complete len:473 (-),score=97.01 GDKJ01015712.1:75-1493(-)